MRLFSWNIELGHNIDLAAEAILDHPDLQNAATPEQAPGVNPLGTAPACVGRTPRTPISLANEELKMVFTTAWGLRDESFYATFSTPPPVIGMRRSTAAKKKMSTPRQTTTET